MSTEEDLEFNVKAIQAVKSLAAAIDCGEYVFTPEFAARLGELNGACARQARGITTPPEDDGEELEVALA